MDTDPDDFSERERRLDEVVAGYLHAKEAGAAPDPAELLACHPDLAPELGKFLDNDRQFERRWVEPLRPGAADDGFPLACPAPQGRTPATSANGYSVGGTTQDEA